MHASAFIENTHKHTVTGIYRGSYKQNSHTEARRYLREYVYRKREVFFHG
jgi:hypothetical protein